MSADKLRTALDRIQHDPFDEEAWTDVEDIVTGDRDDAIERELEGARTAAEALRDWPVVARLLELEIAVSENPALTSAKQFELGRIHKEELFRSAPAIEAFRGVLSFREGDDVAQGYIDELEAGQVTVQEDVEQALVEALDTEDDAVRGPQLARAAELTIRYGERSEAELKKAEEYVVQALKVDASARVLTLAAEIHRVQRNWADLAEVLESKVQAAAAKEEKIAAAHQWAAVARGRLDDQAKAVEAHSTLLDLDPKNELALNFLVDHFTAQEDWDHLAAVYEDLVESGADTGDELGTLIQLAMLNWRTRNLPEQAEPWFERIRRLAPENPAMLDFFREVYRERGDTARLMTVLTEAQRAMPDGDERNALAAEIAGLAEGQENARRAIEQYKSILRSDPDNDEARTRLKSLYLETESFNALVELLRQELSRLGDEEDERKVAILREIAAIYRDRMESDTALLTVLTQILQIDDADMSAVRDLVRVYESLGRWRDLLNMQQRLAELTDNETEKEHLLRSVARRWLEQFSNVQNAMGAFEALLEVVPGDAEARRELRELYQKRRAWDKLYELYERQLDELEGQTRIDTMLEMAKLAAERLNRGEDAIRLLKEVLVFDPNAEGVIDALERQAERQKDYPTVAHVLERRIDETEDLKPKISLLQKLGVLFSDKIGDVDKSNRAWRRVLELSPGHKRALRVLRQAYVDARDWDGLEELYISQEDFEGLADFLSTTADRVEEDEHKVALSFRAAKVYEDSLGVPERAARSYERILSIDEHNVEAARALLPIYEEDEKWNRLPALYDVLLETTEDVDAKIEILNKVAEITGGPLANKGQALAYARKAYELRKDEQGLDNLREWSQQAGEWEAFIEVVEGRLEGEELDEAGRRELTLMLAQVYSGEVGQNDEAVKLYRGLLEKDPTDGETAAELEQLLRATDRREDLRWLFELKVSQADGEAQCGQLEEWAAVEEEVFGEPERAIALLRRVIEADPSRVTGLEALVRLLLAGERWEEASEMMSLHRDAVSGEERVRSETALARLYLAHLERPEDALAATMRALELEPTDGEAVALLEELLELPVTRARAATALERIYAELGEAEKQTGALRALLETEEEAARRLELFQSLARVHEEGLDDPGAAFAVILTALAEAPMELDLWDRAAELGELAERHNELAEAYRKLLSPAEEEPADAEPSEPEDEVSAPDDDGAAETAEEGEAAEPDDGEEIATDEGAAGADTVADADDESAHADAEAAAEVSRPEPDDALVIELAHRAAVLHEERLSDPEGAVPYLERILEVDPTNEGAFERLKAILNAVERWGELEGLYDRTIAVVEDPTQKIALLHQAAVVAEDMIGNDDKAIASYERIVEIDPLHVDAVVALERLYGREERYADLARLLEQKLETAVADELQDIHHQLVEIYLHKLRRYGPVMGHLERLLDGNEDDLDARALAEECLDVDELRQPAARLLDRVYESVDDPRDLVRVLGIRLEGVEDEDQRRELLHRIATLQDERLKDDAGAFETLCQLLPLEPDDAQIRERLSSVGRRLGEAEKMAETLLKSAERTNLPTTRGELLMEAASLLRDHIENPVRAEQVYDEVLAIDPDDPDLVIPAAQALAGIHQEQGHHERLAKVLTTEVRLTADLDEQKALWARIANIYEDLLEDDARAIEAWKARVVEDSADMDALRSLERLYERTEQWTELVETLQQLEQNALAGDERKRCMVKAAETLAEHLEETVEAINAWRAVLDDFGPEPDTLSALAKLYRKAERWEDLAEVLDTWLSLTDDPDEEVSLHAALGDVRRQHLDDPQGAIMSYREVLTRDPGHAPVRAALEAQLEHEDPEVKRGAAELLGPLHEADGDAEKLLHVLDIEIEVIFDPIDRLDKLERALNTAEDQLEDPDRAFGYASRGVREALGEPAVRGWIDLVERLASVTEKYEELLELYEAVVADMLDAEIQQSTRLRAGELARDRLEDRERAVKHYRAALDVQADDERAMIALEELYADMGDNPALLGVLRMRSDIAETDDDRVELLFRVAELQAGPLEQRDEAILTYEDICNLELVGRATDALEKLYAEAERFEDLVALHERQLDEAEGDRVAELRVKIARVAHTHLHDDHRALDELGAALEADEDHGDAISLLERLLAEAEEPEQRSQVARRLEPVYLAAHDWDKLEGALKARLETAFDPEDRAALLSRLATLYEEQLENYAAALDMVARRLKEDPVREEIWAEVERLGRVVGDEGDEEDAVPAEQRVADIFADALEEVTADEPATARLAARTGELYAEVEKYEAALSWYRRAHAFEPESTELFEAIDRVLIALDRKEERVEHYRAGLDNVFDDEVRVRYLHVVAKLLRELGRVEDAIATYNEIVDIDEHDTPAQDALAKLYERADRPEDLAELYERRADLAESPEEAAPFRIDLARLLVEDELTKDRALDQLEMIVADLPEHPEAIAELEKMLADDERKQRVIDALRPLYEMKGHWEGLIRLNDERLGLLDYPADQVEVLANTAALWEDQGGQPEKAFEVTRRAFLIAPDHEDTRANLARLAEDLDAWDDLADSYEEACEKVEDEFVKRPLLDSLATVCDQRLDDPRRALRALRTLSELEPSEPEPLARMRLLCTLLADWEQLVKVLRQQSDNALGDDDRAEILRELGAVKRDMLADEEGAIAVFEEALDVMPGSGATLDQLIGLYRDRDQDRLVDLLEQRVEATDFEEAELKYALILEAAEVFEEKLERPEESIRVLQVALDGRPDDTDLLDRLARLYEKQGEYDALLDNLKAQAEYAADTEERLALRNRIGDLYLEHFENAFDALEQYRMVLSEDDGDAHAIAKTRAIGEESEELRLEVSALLEPVLQAAGDYENLVAVMELRFSAQTDPTDRAQTLSAIALLREEQLDQPSEARDTLLRALTETPDSEDLHSEIERLCELTGDWKAYADTLATRAQETYDAVVQTDLYTRLGRIAEERLEDTGRAIEAFQHASEQAAEPGELLASLDRLYLAAEKWEDLGRVLERRLDFEEGSGRADLLHRLGALQIERFDQKEMGLSTLRQAVDIDPEHAGAREQLEKLTEDEALFEEAAEALEQMYRVAGDNAARAKLRNKRIGFAPTATDRVQLRIELAQMLEDETGDTDSAQDVIQQAFADDPSEPELLAQLERLAATNADGEAGAEAWKRAADAVGTSVQAALAREEAGEGYGNVTPELARDLYLRSASWYEEKCEDLDAAEKRLGLALEQDPKSADALLSLERIARATERWSALVDTLRKLATLVDAGDAMVDRSSAELRKEAKIFADEQLEDRDLAEAIVRDMLAVDDADVWALTELSAVCRDKEAWEELYQHLSRRIELMPEADELRELRHEAGTVARDRLEQHEDALNHFEAAFEDDPSDEEAATALRGLYEKLERYDDMLRFVERLIDQSDDAQVRADLRLECARISIEVLGSPSEGIDHLHQVLGEVPGHPGAVELLAKMLEKEGRDEELADLLSQQIDLAREAGEQEQELAYRVQLSELYESRLNDPDKAIDGYLGVLETDASFRPALAALARLYEAQDKQADAAEMVEKLLEGAETAERVELALKARELHGAVEAPERAIAVLEKVADDEGLEPEALASLRSGLRELYEAGEHWEPLAALITREGEEAEDADAKVVQFRKAATIHSDKRDDHASAAELLEKALALKEDDRDLMLTLCDEYTAAGRGRASIEVLEKVVESYNGRRSKELADIHQRIASAYVAEGDSVSALEQLEQARKMDPGSVNILFELGSLSLRLAEDASGEEQADHIKRAGNAFRALLLQRLDASAPLTKADIFYHLARVSQLDGDTKKAKQNAERALSNDKEHEKAKALLEELG